MLSKSSCTIEIPRRLDHEGKVKLDESVVCSEWGGGQVVVNLEDYQYFWHVQK